jgi:hypothetical protein
MREALRRKAQKRVNRLTLGKAMKHLDKVRAVLAKAKNPLTIAEIAARRSCAMERCESFSMACISSGWELSRPIASRFRRWEARPTAFYPEQRGTQQTTLNWQNWCSELGAGSPVRAADRVGAPDAPGSEHLPFSCRLRNYPRLSCFFHSSSPCAGVIICRVLHPRSGRVPHRAPLTGREERAGNAHFPLPRLQQSGSQAFLDHRPGGQQDHPPGR